MHDTLYFLLGRATHMDESALDAVLVPPLDTHLPAHQRLQAVNRRLDTLTSMLEDSHAQLAKGLGDTSPPQQAGLLALQALADEVAARLAAELAACAEWDALSVRADGLSEGRNELRERILEIRRDRDLLLGQRAGLEKEKDDLSAQVLRLSEEKDALSSRADRLSKEKNGLSEERNELRKQLLEIRREKELLLGQMAALEKDKNDLSSWKHRWGDAVALMQLRGVHRWGLGSFKSLCVIRPRLQPEVDEKLALLRWRTSMPKADANAHCRRQRVLAIDLPSGTRTFAVDSLLGVVPGDNLESDPPGPCRHETEVGVATPSPANIAAQIDPVIRAALRLDGSHSVVLAYGHSGGGKTTCLRHMIHQAAEGIFGGGGDDESQRVPLEVRVSFVQEYLGDLEDLLFVGAADEGASPVAIPPLGTTAAAASLERTKAAFLQNATVRTASSPREILDFYAEGRRRRKVRSTAANAHSSRSHSLLTFVVCRKIKQPQVRGVDDDAFAVLTFMDLAGHEPPDHEGGGQAREEGMHTNKELNLLGQVLAPGRPLRKWFNKVDRWGGGEASSLLGSAAKRDEAKATETRQDQVSDAKTNKNNNNRKTSSSKQSSNYAKRPAAAAAPDFSPSLYVFRACPLTQLLGHFLGFGGSGTPRPGTNCGDVARVLMVVLAVAPSESRAAQTVNTLGLIGGWRGGDGGGGGGVGDVDVEVEVD